MGQIPIRFLAAPRPFLQNSVSEYVGHATRQNNSIQWALRMRSQEFPAAERKSRIIEWALLGPQSQPGDIWDPEPWTTESVLFSFSGALLPFNLRFAVCQAYHRLAATCSGSTGALDVRRAQGPQPWCSEMETGCFGLHSLKFLNEDKPGKDKEDFHKY